MLGEFNVSSRKQLNMQFFMVVIRDESKLALNGSKWTFLLKFSL